MHNIKIISSSTRPGRKGVAIEQWISRLAKQHESFEVELLDLSQINLPFMDEPNHPRLKQYTKEHTRNWSGTIDSADGYIIVLSEYNFSFPAPIKNALDFLFHEWAFKPVAFVSYGGISGGLRSTQMLKQVVTTLNMMPVVEQVNIPFFAKMIDDQEVFQPTEAVQHSAQGMFKSLEKWSEALKPMRATKG